MHEIADLASFPMMISADDVLHLRGMSLNGLLGVSRIGMARDAIGLSLALEGFVGFSLVALVLAAYSRRTRRLSDATFDRLKAQINQRHEGVENHGKSMLLEEGLKWVASRP
jgi:phage portal protein BeeE